MGTLEPGGDGCGGEITRSWHAPAPTGFRRRCSTYPFPLFQFAKPDLPAAAWVLQKTEIDAPSSCGQFAQAQRLREVLYSVSPFYRLINAEALGLPGLKTSTRFDEKSRVVQVTTAGMENSGWSLFWRRSIKTASGPPPSMPRAQPICVARTPRSRGLRPHVSKASFRSAFRGVERCVLFCRIRRASGAPAGITINGTTGCSWRAAAAQASCWMPIVTVGGFPCSPR